MHIAVNGWFWGRPGTGSGQYLRRVLPELMALAPGWRWTMIAPERPDDLPEGVISHILPVSGGAPGKVWFEQVRYPRTCGEIGADCLWVPYWASPLRAPAPIMTTIHDLIPLVRREYRGGLLGRLYTALVSASARGSDLILTDSGASRRDIVEHLKVDPGRVHVALLAAAPDYGPHPDETDPAAREKYGLPAEYVLYLGGVDVRKNVRAAIRAQAMIWEAARVPLVIAGARKEPKLPRFPDLVKAAREAGLVEGESIRFVGWIDEEDKPALYRMASVFIFPSMAEGFGLPPLEAMACGTPVIVSDATSLPEVVGGAGYAISPGDVRGFAGALLAVLTDPDLTADLREKGLRRAALFSWERTARATLEALRHLQT